MRLAFLGLLVLSSTASAQIFSAGVRGGVPFGSEGLQKWTIGPTIEFKPPIVPLRFVADALYKRVDTGVRTVSVWDFPLMVRLEIPTPLVKPFVGGGPVFRRFSVAGFSQIDTGFVAGTGLRLTVPFVKVTPEFRFSRAANDNQGEFLIGITF